MRRINCLGVGTRKEVVESLVVGVVNNWYVTFDLGLKPKTIFIFFFK